MSHTCACSIAEFVYMCITNSSSRLNVTNLWQTQAPAEWRSHICLCVSRELDESSKNHENTSLTGTFSIADFIHISFTNLMRSQNITNSCGTQAFAESRNHSHVCSTNSTSHFNITNVCHTQALAKSRSHSNVYVRNSTSHLNFTNVCHTGAPNVPELQIFCFEKFGWQESHTSEVLRPGSVALLLQCCAVCCSAVAVVLQCCCSDCVRGCKNRT